MIYGFLYMAGVCIIIEMLNKHTKKLATQGVLTYFFEAQDTTLHFPRVENSDCILASPLPTKRALWDPCFDPLEYLYTLRGRAHCLCGPFDLCSLSKNEVFDRLILTGNIVAG